MEIRVFSNLCLVVTVLGLGLLILVASHVLDTLDEITEAERQKYRSLRLANELFWSSEDLTKMARSYVATGDSIYEQLFYEILDMRNGKRARPENYMIAYWNMGETDLPHTLGEVISLADLMRREGFSERELNLLQQSQKYSDNLVDLEKQAFAAIKGLYDDGQGNFTVSRAPDREFAIGLLFGKRYNTEKSRIMVPINQFMQELDSRTQNTLNNLQSKFQRQVMFILIILCSALLVVAVATFYIRRHILRPLDYLSRQATSIAQGSYSTRCDIITHDEIAELSTNFNTMAESIEHEIVKLKQVEASLRERLKEINCIYTIRRSMEAAKSLEEACEIICVYLIAAMQFPNIASIRIELNGQQFVSDQYDKDHACRLQKQIEVYGEAHGWLFVFYGEHQPFLLPEEQNLINVIGDDLGKWLERKQAEAHILVERELRVRDTVIREFAAHVEQMREEDRKYIAREIHDELGQLLAALRLEISLLKSGHNHQNERQEVITCNMSKLIDRADQSVRNVAEHLRPASLGLGIISALKKLTNEFRKLSGITCTLRLTDESIDLDEDQTVAIFRIVQESLTNVTRHAEASCVEITIRQDRNDFCVEVRDDGKGFDMADAKGKKSFGLLGMRERVEVLRGSISIVSAPGQGTVINVRIPVKQRETL